ncbi:MAG: hypothetical protein KDN19_00065 [Verrucomicrobiae bacterium]|nr:hypothetical protein [Verrucomicrobiae bacterium]
MNDRHPSKIHAGFRRGVGCRIGIAAPPYLLSLVLFFWSIGSINLFSVPLKGANGKVVDFVGIKSGGPDGLKVQLVEDGDSVDVPWEKFDLESLKNDQPVIFKAYEASKGGETTVLDLGSFKPNTPSPSAKNMSKGDGQGGLFDPTGWGELKVGGGRFVMQLPEGDPKGVLLVSVGIDGRSSRYVGRGRFGKWAEYFEKFQFAVMSYDFPMSRDSGGAGKGYFQPGNASFEATIDAIAKFGSHPRFANAEKIPIALYGFDVPGAAFAFNFAQKYHERVLAAVVAKGAFYSNALSAESVKVPLLLISGENDIEVKSWKPENTMEVVYPQGRELGANWVYAREPRAGSGETMLSMGFAKLFLQRMILARLTPTGEVKSLDSEDSWIGNLETFEIGRREGSETLSQELTWLPNGEIAKAWANFCQGIDLEGE